MGRPMCQNGLLTGGTETEVLLTCEDCTSYKKTNTGTLAREEPSMHVVVHFCNVISSSHPGITFSFVEMRFGGKEYRCPQ